jgi:hypothetical protein
MIDERQLLMPQTVVIGEGNRDDRALHVQDHKCSDRFQAAADVVHPPRDMVREIPLCGSRKHRQSVTERELGQPTVEPLERFGMHQIKGQIRDRSASENEQKEVLRVTMSYILIRP